MYPWQTYKRALHDKPLCGLVTVFFALATLKLVPDVCVRASGTATASGTGKRYSPGGGHVFMSYPAFAAASNASCQAAADAE